MKFKHVVASFGLTLAMGFSAVAGLLANKEVKVTKADEPDDKMITVLVDMGEATEYEGFNSPEVHVLDETNASIDKYQMLHLITGTIYGGTISYRSADQSINAIEFLFKQYSEDKFSGRLSVSPTYSTACKFSYHNEWISDPSDGGRYEWTLSKDTDWNGIRFQYYGSGDNNIQNLYLQPNVSDKSYKASFEIYEEGFDPTDAGQIFLAGWNLGAVRQTSINKYLTDYSLNSFKFSQPGKYDLYFYDSYEDSGVFEIKKYEENESYIYYVTASSEATSDYIYSWGGSEQFGAFPGTSIAALVLADEAEEVTGNGVIHFQGGDTPKLIYKINVVIGYPNGDTMFMFNNGTGEYKSDERELKAENAYWWTGSANREASFGLEFVIIVDSYRSSAEDYSVCNISKESATFLVNLYNAQDDDILQTYIDCSSIYTWKDSAMEEESLFSVKKIIEELGAIAEITPKGSSLALYQLEMNNNSALIIIISVAAVSTLAFTLLLVFKKKRK